MQKEHVNVSQEFEATIASGLTHMLKAMSKDFSRRPLFPDERKITAEFFRLYANCVEEPTKENYNVCLIHGIALSKSKQQF
jgi:hypothetical protein